ncbi:MAG: GTP cyclohydrolase I FolE [Candidatus Marinimicrobia bacterium]|nr:GTP cyclohydrolase I FolE [Candidatus Neomarinimicrobiota bacterium]
MQTEELIRQLLINIGEDPSRDSLEKTPERVAEFWGYATRGYKVDIDALLKESVSNDKYDQMILIKDIDYYSLCEHHLVPFFGKAHIAYIPDGKTIGLSKIPRIVDAFARRLQIQERLTNQVAEAIQNVLQPKGVAVIIEATHLCMQMRGVEKHNSVVTTSAMFGVFRENERTRMEFLDLIKISRI